MTNVDYFMALFGVASVCLWGVVQAIEMRNWWLRGLGGVVAIGWGMGVYNIWTAWQ